MGSKFQLDLDRVKDLLRTADSIMTEYETQMKKNPYGKNNFTYLSMAEDRLIEAESQGIDTTAQRLRFKALKKKYICLSEGKV